MPTCPSPVVTYMSFWCKQAPSSCSSCNAHTWRMGPDWAWEAPFPSMGPPGSPRGGMLPSSKGHKSFVICPPVTPSGLEGAGLLPRRAGTGQSCLFRPRLPYSHVWRGASPLQAACSGDAHSSHVSVMSLMAGAASQAMSVCTS